MSNYDKEINQFVDKHLDDYLKTMADELYNLAPGDYSSAGEAFKVIERYKNTLEEIGWRWLPEEYAERLHEKIRKGISPEEWFSQVTKFEDKKDEDRETRGDTLIKQDERPSVQELTQKVKQLRRQISSMTSKSNNQFPVIVITSDGHVYKVKESQEQNLKKINNHESPAKILKKVLNHTDY
ncbi:hypothetical protein ACQCVP_22695 [Rossellomorea vietnamensis]|uniref:hypothetical protein n=1 Tax=Rossellomorea vietnamensis TaxID=218284 RepID=UPI003CEED1B0